MRAHYLRLAAQRQCQALPKTTEPCDLACGHAQHQREVAYVTGDDGSGANKGVPADSDSTYDRAICAQRRSLAHVRAAIFCFSAHRGAGVIDIGEYHAGTTEHVVFERYSVIHRNVVLHLDVVADVHIVANEDVLAERTA